MEEEYKQEEGMPTQVEAAEKLSLGVKVALTVGVVGAVATGIFLAIILS